MGAKSLSTQNIEHGQTRCTREVVSSKRASVLPRQPCRHLLRGDHCPKRQTAADGLREADNIWLHPKLLGSEKRARPIAACLHLSLIHISEPTRRTPISYAVFCLKKKKT